jgi:hypothetical protein
MPSAARKKSASRDYHPARHKGSRRAARSTRRVEVPLDVDNVELIVGGRMVTFGVAEETFVATPAEDHVTVEFAFDLADHDKEILSGLTLDLNIYGAFADSGIVATGGLTFVNVPTLVEVEEEVEG